MELNIDEDILKAYGFTLDIVNLQQIGSGHINRTYLLSALQNDKQYILQNINVHVFKDPFAIANNIEAVADYLKANNPDYLFPAPIPTLHGELMFAHHGDYWRLLPFVANTMAYDTLSDPNRLMKPPNNLAS